jgi:hypothetical protein
MDVFKDNKQKIIKDSLIVKNEEVCHGDEPYFFEHDVFAEFNKNNKHSLTHLGSLSGASHVDNARSFKFGDREPVTTYGAQFKTVDYDTPYYEYMTHGTVEPPWLAQHQEGTFLNNIKALNEPPVETYKHLKLDSISSQKFKPYESILNEQVKEVEGFGMPLFVEKNINNIMKIIIVSVFIIFIYLSNK